MNKYQLAKLVDWAGTIDTRKRMQKLVFMLQAAGCDFDADYFLHRYGPYSQEVARLTDEMVRMGILEELSRPNQAGQQFSYKLTERGREQLNRFDEKHSTSVVAANVNKFQSLAKELAAKDLRELEVASTIAYYHFNKRLDWDTATESAFSFKKVDDGSPFAERAVALAKSVEHP